MIISYPDLAFLSPLALMEVVNSPCDAGLLYVFDKAVLHSSGPALACLCSLHMVCSTAHEWEAAEIIQISHNLVFSIFFFDEQLAVY